MRFLFTFLFLTISTNAQYVQSGFNRGSGNASTHTFTFVGSTKGTTCTSALNSCSATRTVTSGHLIIIETITAVNRTGQSVTSITCGDPTDGASAATATTTSPYSTQTASDLFYDGIFYFISTAASGSTVFTCNFTTSPSSVEHFSSVNIAEFSYTGSGSVVFDKDALATFPNSTGSSPYTTPCISPTKTGSLLFGVMVNDVGGMTAAGSPWTYISTTGYHAYVLSSSAGSTCANFTDSSSTDSSGVQLAAFN